MNTAPIHGTTQHLNARIAAASSPSKPDEITHFGIFTTEVRVDLAVRHLYVSRGCDVLPHLDRRRLAFLSGTDYIHDRRGDPHIGFLKALPPAWSDVSSLKDLNISAMIYTSLDVSYLFADSCNLTDRSIQNLLIKGYKLMGSRRMENDSHENIYFCLSHIELLWLDTQTLA
jgi:hypothetical protein